MENRPEYVGIWIGLSKIGAVGALINTNLRNDPLVHSIQVADSKALIYGSELVNGRSNYLLGVTVNSYKF